ncbi:hypothetical protein Trisim1_006043 [Trichoderma cf. simile WF8]
MNCFITHFGQIFTQKLPCAAPGTGSLEHQSSFASTEKSVGNIQNDPCRVSLLGEQDTFVKKAFSIPPTPPRPLALLKFPCYSACSNYDNSLGL